jgi:hypothetical protein
MLAFSAGAMETAINTEQTLDVTLPSPQEAIIQLVPQRDDNAAEATGLEEVDVIYERGNVAKADLSYEMAQPQHFAFFYGYGLGVVSSAAAGDGYEHTITPIAGDLDGSRSNPTFTAGQALGKTIFKRRFASLAVDTATATFARGAWAKLGVGLVGTGKYTDNITEETVSAAGNAVSLALAANAVQGSTAGARLDAVHRIRVELTSGIWTEVVYSAVSAATPAVITIASAGGGAGLVNYKILYVPTESAWMSLPARVTETPLKVAGLTLTVGGAWDGSDFSGGRPVNVELQSIETVLNNNLRVEFVPGISDQYGGAIIRGGRVQTIKLEQEMRQFMLQHYVLANETFGLHILLQGAVFDDPHAYQVEMIYPQCKVLDAPITVKDKRMAEAGDLKVLDNATYGSVIIRVKNLQSAYAA